MRTTQTIGGIAVALLILLAAACRNGTTSIPAAPSPATPPPQAPSRPHPSMRQLSGFVLDDGDHPIQGATVTVYNAGDAQVSLVVTDGAGFYRASATAYQEGNEVVVKKTGYETTTNWIAGSTDAHQDLRLFPFVTLTSGETAGLSMPPNPASSLCGLEDEFTCRVVHVRTPGAGTLIVQASGDSPSVVFAIVLGDLGDFHYPIAIVSSASRTVEAGDVVTVKILRPWTSEGGGRFTLTTELRQA